MPDEKQFPPLTDHQITQTMMVYGGSFVQQLGKLFRIADEDNKIKLKFAFHEYWTKYAKMTVRCPQCGGTDIGGWGDEFNDYKSCDACGHKWNPTGRK